ncbi:MAG: peptidase M64 [Ignavibacteriales bacterium]|nr:MAG: peptidase M64 [Ignavibacteriales bacterium]
MRLLILIFIISANVSYSQIKFESYFEDKSLRIDYIHAGNATEDSYFLKELREEPYWGGSLVNLIDTFNLGKYKIELIDKVSGKLIYSRHYATLFSEWQTTDEAKKITKAFEESMLTPFPKKPVIVKFYTRDRRNALHEKYAVEIDPANYFILKDQRMPFDTMRIHYTGDHHKKLDIVILAEGYTADDMGKFETDCRKFTDYLFNSSPYKERKDDFNIWGVKVHSKEAGTDIPKPGVYRNTALGSSFYTFDVERYLMTESFFAVRDAASNVPYDQIFILVNSGKYGGGAIYNHYSVCVNNNQSEEYIFVHEFGHGFASLADEYYTSEVAYNEFYPVDIEPLEANVTTLVDFDKKWKHMIAEGTPVPTPATVEYENKLGAFEGGGYAAKGIYRPRQDCTMKSISVDNFCPVCSKALSDMIDFYSR